MSNRLKRRAARRRQHQRAEQDRRQMLLPFAQKSVRLHLRLLPYWSESAAREGYATIQDAILGIYRETGSLMQTAERMNFSWWTIRNKLLEMGAPIGKPGGPNNPYGRAGKPKRDDDTLPLFVA